MAGRAPEAPKGGERRGVPLAAAATVPARPGGGDPLGPGMSRADLVALADYGLQADLIRKCS